MLVGWVVAVGLSLKEVSKISYGETNRMWYLGLRAQHTTTANRDPTLGIIKQSTNSSLFRKKQSNSSRNRILTRHVTAMEWGQ